jgi:hypothetical protein
MEELAARVRAIEILLEHLLSREDPDFLRHWSDEVVLPTQENHPASPLLHQLELRLEAAIRMQVARVRRGQPERGPS